MKKPKTKRVQRLVRIREVRLIGVELVLSRPVDEEARAARAFAKLQRAADRHERTKAKRAVVSE